MNMQGTSQPITINVVRGTRQRYDNYYAKTALAFAILQILLAVASIVTNSVAIAFQTPVSFVAYGIWLPVFWVIAGAFGIASSYKKSKCTIITTMVMSIISASFMAVFVGLIVPQFLNIDGSDYYYDYVPDDCGRHEDFNPDFNGTEVWYNDCIYYSSKENTKKYVASGFMVVVALAELVVSIIASAVCCHAVCCCKERVNNGANTASYVVVNTFQVPQASALQQGLLGQDVVQVNWPTTLEAEKHDVPAVATAPTAPAYTSQPPPYAAGSA